MSDNENKYDEINALLSGILRQTNLREMFDKRLYELNISQYAAEKIMNIAHRTLDGILDGTQKRPNFINIQKIGVFLNISTDKVFEAHQSMLDKNSEEDDTALNKKRFIRENFDLPSLKKAGFINNIMNFEEIEKRIVSFFGFTSIFDYKKRSFDSAFSAGAFMPKNSATRDFWLTSAKNIATKIDNPYYFDRQALITYFPQIRWQSTNVELGLVYVVKELFKLGVTVIYQAPLASLHLRGATFSVNEKPCIVLTDYKGFYPTLWQCLIHELYHVLFDWEEIKTNSYHLSEDGEALLTVDEKEMEANDFARKYLFSQEKMAQIQPYMRMEKYIDEIAKSNNIHPSIIHAYYAFDNNKTDRLAWMRAKRYMPEIKKAIYHFGSSWSEAKPIDEVVKKIKIEIYN
jgi:hypothetical protein